MDAHVYSLRDVLAVAKIHPFYNQDRKYPPDSHAVQLAQEQAGTRESADVDLRPWPLLWKSQLYTVIRRLIDDRSPENTYRRSIYASSTGGGAGANPLFFMTDVEENRRQRKSFGQFLRKIGIVTPGDWVLTVNIAGGLYRSLDLMSEILENAGASVLSAGHIMPPNEVIQSLRDFHVNVLAGDSSHVTQLAHYISTLSPAERESIHLEKIIYTSEMLTPAQRSYIHHVLGPIKICSVMASAETGPWTASNPEFTGDSTIMDTADFIFDTRSMKIEIFPLSCQETDQQTPNPLPDGEQGFVVTTSLSRLRHPVVRYLTGDIASIHPLPEQARAKLSDEDWQHLRVLRLVGRDRRLSFDWDGGYIEFTNLKELLEDKKYAILQWQVILSKMESDETSFLEIRILCASEERDSAAHQKMILDRLIWFFQVGSSNADRFRVTFVGGMDEFERSSTGRKVIKFIDRFNN
ncbi:hypothetical protein GGS21DRAFT_548515 [Xylaria nigripes]|nr:hypothetical protein GGS21DRAFT_548515 [Xylaria nigripes]